MLDRFFIHQINTPSSRYYFSKVLLQKRGMSYAKVIHKKEREEKKKKEKRKKWAQKCSRYLKQWVLICPSEKRR
jgi:hypothetical protein